MYLQQTWKLTVRRHVAQAVRASLVTVELLEQDTTRNVASGSRAFWRAHRPELPGWNLTGEEWRAIKTREWFVRGPTDPRLQQKETGVLRLPPATQKWKVHMNQEFERRQRRCLMRRWKYQTGA